MITHKLTAPAMKQQLLDSQWLEREVGSVEKKRTQYYVYVLEANLVLSGGMTVPLIVEFLDYTKGDTEHEKQDCEQRAFYLYTESLRITLFLGPTHRIPASAPFEDGKPPMRQR